MPTADLDSASTTGAGAHVAPAPGPVHDRVLGTADVAVVGGGCIGLATAVRLADHPGRPTVVVLEGRADPDPRSWCAWDDGTDPVPEARSASWDHWEVRTDHGTATGTDRDHPYVLARAADRLAAVERRLATSDTVRLVRGAVVTATTGGVDGVGGGGGVGGVGGVGGGVSTLHTSVGTVDAHAVLDARGPRCPEDVGVGRVLLHQRFVGQWIETERPVFDPTTVTLMDFCGQPTDGPVHFVYVLPVSPTRALVESTVFTPNAVDRVDHRAVVAAYVERRWGLAAGAWRVVDEEHGCIPMTDAPPALLTAGARVPDHAPGVQRVVGTTRPSSGYGFARSNRHSALVAAHLADGTRVPALVDRARTRFLDAVFLRFLRDRPEQAPEAFRRLVALPGPLVVRFLTDRSTIGDDLRIVLALQKRPFLAALVRTAADAVVRLRARAGHGPSASPAPAPAAASASASVSAPPAAAAAAAAGRP